MGQKIIAPGMGVEERIRDLIELPGMRYVYILRSLKDPGKRYIGVTDNLVRRLNRHNQGSSPHTSKFRPWVVETYIGFSDVRKALEFERYLKTGAGWAFSLKRF